MSQIKDNSLTKKERLCGKSVISDLFNSNDTLFCYPFRCLWSIRQPKEGDASEVEASCVSVLFSVPKKKIKRANKRNLIKRRMKESYRLNKHSLTESLSASNRSINMALMYVSTDIIDYHKIEAAIKTLLHELEKINK